MDNHNGTGNPEILREEIRRTRSELSQTLEALAGRADVKARLRESTGQARQRMRVQAAQTRQRVRDQATRAIGRGRSAGGVGTAELDQRRLRRTAVPVGLLVAGAVVSVIVVLLRRRRG